MKTPDKIYCGNNGHGNLSFSTEKVYDTMSEYIRKDALLEWAKERYNHYAQEPGKAGERDVCLQLIDKLNSM